MSSLTSGEAPPKRAEAEVQVLKCLRVIGGVDRQDSDVKGRFVLSAEVDVVNKVVEWSNSNQLDSAGR